MAAVGGDVAEAKLNMSLDELIASKKDHDYGEDVGSKRVARRQHKGHDGRGRGHHGRGMGQRWNGGQSRGHGQGGPMQQQQQQFHPQQLPPGQRMQQQQMQHGRGAYNNGWEQQMQPQMGYQQPYGPQHHMQQQMRGSVFERLGGHGPGRGGGGRGGPPGRPGGPPVTHYKLAVAQDADTGDVTVTFRDTTIIQVRPTGEVVLDTCNNRSKAMLGALNQALQKINLKVTALPTPAAAAGVAPRSEVVWNVSDGRSLQRFEDGMVVPYKGTATAARGRVMLRAHGIQPAVAAAAQEASTQAARAAGLMGDGDAAMGEGDAAAAAGGEEEADFMEGDFEEYGAEDPDAARIRREKAKGRFNPY